MEQQGEDVQIVRLLDYHTLPEGIKLPYTVRIGDGDTKFDEVNTVQSAVVNAATAQIQFALPPNPAPDFRFQNGATSATIPFRLDNDKLLVPVKLNGQGPFEAELNSGGSYIVQPALVAQLRLRAQGSLQTGGGGEGFVTSGETVVDTVDLGDLRLTKQPYDVLAFRDGKPLLTLMGLQILPAVRRQH